MKINVSPNRHSFQKDKYILRCESEGKAPSIEYLEMFNADIKRHNERFDDPSSKVNNMEYDLLTTQWICDKAKASEVYAQNLYAAMCNNRFRRNDVWPLLKEEKWSCSWRYAGGIVADMREEGDYIDWYCSGIKGSPSINEDGKQINDGIEGYVGEAFVTDEIREDLLKLGWIVLDDDKL